MQDDDLPRGPDATPIDAAFAAQAAAPGDDALSLRFHERVLDAELVLPLEAEAGHGVIEPRVFDLSDGRFVLAFDRDVRMAAFLEAPVPFAALSGRGLAAMLSGRGVGIALNLGAPSATLLPAATVDWLAAMAGRRPEEATARLTAVEPAGAVAAGLVAGVGPKLAAMPDAVEAAWLVRATLESGESRLVLALAGVPEAARPGVSAAMAEAVRFGTDAAELDVVFLEAGSALLAAVARVGSLLSLPKAEPVRAAGPGMDPDRPPRLRQ